MRAKPIDVDRVNEILVYEPDTGFFRWRVSRGRGKAGSRAGRISQPYGYRQIQIDGAYYMAHRLAYAITFGDQPPEIEIDHKNGKRDENWIDNLRAGANGLNKQNRHNLDRRNTTGVTGVSYVQDRNRYLASIKVDKVNHHLGHFRTVEEAKAARYAGEKKHFSFGPKRPSTISVTF